MITLYQWPSHGRLPNAGLFCMKLESYLRVMKIEHTIKTTLSLKKSPKKTIPYIDLDGKLISDSQIIIDYLEDRSPQTAMDRHLNEMDRAHAQAYRLLIEKELVPILMYFRWAYPQGWDQFSRLIFKNAPTLIRHLIGGKMRKDTMLTLHRNGISRHSLDEILQFAEKDFQSLATLLGDKTYVFGDKISTLDLGLFAITSNVLMGGVKMPLQDVVRKYPNLIQHSRLLMREIYDRPLEE